jgi:hypothetical protein
MGAGVDVAPEDNGQHLPATSDVEPIVLQNYFWPGTEERHSKLSSEQRILIQETTVSDSIIAHFGRSTAHRPTFATQSEKKQSESVYRIGECQ